MINKILVLTDFSDIADYGIKASIDFAHKYEAHLVILHAEFKGDDTRIKINDPSVDNMILLREYEKGKVASWSQQCKQLGVEAELIFSTEDLIGSTQKILDDYSPDLIIMGATGKGKSNNYWGSHTEEVINDTNSPILILKKELEDIDFKNVIFASSFVTQEKEPFSRFMGLFDFSNETVIHLLSIDTKSFFFQPASVVLEAMSEYKVIARPIKATSHFFRNYDVKNGIRHFSNEINPDLVVMSEKTKKPIKHLILGHNATMVAKDLDFPVLVIDY